MTNHPNRSKQTMTYNEAIDFLTQKSPALSHQEIVGAAMMVMHIFRRNVVALLATFDEAREALRAIMREYRHVMGDETAEIKAAYAVLAKMEDPTP